ncbi:MULTISPECIES: fused MFS/spermidine synthase [unclassified Corynebacterium]|uniref:spermidine synthase n=1 Tax=unclassified Corynebacterium TaxID=2624378 RepID=UPI0029CA7D68|nr:MULTISPECIES: fused MFS/spermidine synthase [unclassified Corynebacterium]WPF67032.1 fused MFS/spermidine synthase [Corynebacterium sp. 22KM0430]WPF69520.1 fused MFS/spermidine synthase [Corynebacterium sp. 21KM1197]
MARQHHPAPQAGTYEISTGTATLERDQGAQDSWTLLVNGAISSHIALGNPRLLSFDYMRWAAAAIEHAVEHRLDPQRLRITHLGGGACTLARYFAAVYPRSRNTVVEIDSALATYVRQWFDIPRSPTVKIRVGEARAVTDSFVQDSRDILIRDVFSGTTTPRPLSTVEFYQRCSQALSPQGLLVLNCGTRADLAEARAEIAGLKEVFAHVEAIADPPMLKGKRYGNIILTASHAETPDRAGLHRHLLGGAAPAQSRDRSWTTALASGIRPRRDHPHG